MSRRSQDEKRKMLTKMLTDFTEALKQGAEEYFDVGSNPTLSAKQKSRRICGFSLFLGVYGIFIGVKCCRLW